ncbi:MAG TPA: tRNA cyclic N6-threonylcarbamoyladenosine(37) synthase TcdA, partial [Clostridia bacterium]|nr:tRNA cyclic N6-threonylcarbamoyladenosine(37) synthase TcdA [Clostridia bacterium]
QSNADEILQTRFDAVFDAIDTPSLKCLLISHCRRRGLPLVVAGGAGGRRDPTAIEVTDLAFSTHDRLLQEVRRRLRKDFNFPRGDQPFGVDCIFSREQVVYPTQEGAVCTDRSASSDLRLDCNSGFGTASFVTGTFGLVAASRIVQQIAGSKAEPVRAESSTDLLAS